MSKWIKKDDMVKVLAGNEKGRTGKVLLRKEDRVLVEGMNMRTKHIKKSQAHPQGGKIQMETPMHVSNLALCDAEGNRFKKVFARTSAEGARELVAIQRGAGDQDAAAGQEQVLRVLRRAKKG